MDVGTVHEVAIGKALENGNSKYIVFVLLAFLFVMLEQLRRYNKCHSFESSSFYRQDPLPTATAIIIS